MKGKQIKQGTKKYEKPKIVFAKKIEVISAVCNSGFGGMNGCKSSIPCTRLVN